MWEKGGYCDKEVGGERIAEKDELGEEEVFEEEQNVTVGNNDTISNFETIFTEAENENFQRKRKNRNTIEMFDDMFDSLDITVVEKVSDHVGEVAETDRRIDPDNSISLLECVDTDSTADITLTSKETIGEAPSSEIAPIAEQAFSCNQCDKTFASETSLKNHTGKNHTVKNHTGKDHIANSSGRFACPECEWTGANRGVVKTHIKKKHK